MPVCNNCTIVKTEHAESLGIQICIARRVTQFMGAFEMLATIDLDNQHRCMRDEVSYVGTDRDLSPEPGSIQSMGANCVPDDPLRRGHISPQCACVRPHTRGDTPSRF